MRQLRVTKNESGEPAVRCPRCDEIVVPQKNPIGLDGYDCPECDQVIEEERLLSFARKHEEWSEGFDGGSRWEDDN